MNTKMASSLQRGIIVETDKIRETLGIIEHRNILYSILLNDNTDWTKRLVKGEKVQDSHSHSPSSKREKNSLLPNKFKWRLKGKKGLVLNKRSDIDLEKYTTTRRSFKADWFEFSWCFSSVTLNRKVTSLFIQRWYKSIFFKYLLKGACIKFLVEHVK